MEFFMNIMRWVSSCVDSPTCIYSLAFPQLLVAIPATWTNSWLSYIQNKLSLAYRTRLTRRVMGQYLGEDESEGTSEKIYYKLCKLPSTIVSVLSLTGCLANLDDRIKIPDQLSSVQSLV